MYIDNSLVCARTELEGLCWRLFAMDVFGRAGWVMNADKGQHPSQFPQFLGFVCELNSMILADIDKVLAFQQRAYVWNVAGVVRKVMACLKSIGQVTRIMLRACDYWMDKTQETFGWDGFDEPSVEAVEELEWWREHLEGLYGQAMITSPDPRMLEVTLAGNASGVGAYQGNI